MTDRAAAQALVEAAAEAWRLRDAGDPERAEARRHCEDASEALGVDVDFVSDERPRGFDGALWWLLHQIVTAIDSGTNPFRGYLEAPTAIVEIYQRHKANLADTPVPREALIEVGIDTLLAALAQPPQRGR